MTFEKSLNKENCKNTNSLLKHILSQMEHHSHIFKKFIIEICNDLESNNNLTISDAKSFKLSGINDLMTKSLNNKDLIKTYDQIGNVQA